jgi:hypothetical protein
MPTLYRTQAGAVQSQGTPIVIHCSDPRYQRHFQEFLIKGLGLDHYALVAVPGGAQLLILEEYLPKYSWVGWRWVKFIVDLVNPSRLILIAHEDCRWYLQARFEHDPSRIRERVTSDLRGAGAGLRKRFGNRPVEMYYGTLSEDGSASFEAL